MMNEERTYTVVSDKWGNEPFETTMIGFTQMCFQVFGDAPKLYEHLKDGYWVATDDTGEVILSTNPKHTGK